MFMDTKQSQKVTKSFDLEPEIERTLQRITTAREEKPYSVSKPEVLCELLSAFLKEEGVRDIKITNLKRLAGGASKEQFEFELEANGKPCRRYVLRLEPVEGVAITSRQREMEALQLASAHVPVPKALWVDVDGSMLGRPALITEFVNGVTKPSNSDSNVTGFGTVLGKDLRSRLVVHFINHLSSIHAIDINDPILESFQIPNADPKQAARWQVNWWTKVWHSDALRGIPILGLAESWLKQNLPDTAELVLVHGDYRTGNYLFDERHGEITAILDWEFVHIGDYHEDLAWTFLRLWSHSENNVLLASSLLPARELANLYTENSGRRIDENILHFYQVLCLYKCSVICLGSGLRAAHEAHNHQDALMSWLAPAGYVFINELIDVIEKGPHL